MTGADAITYNLSSDIYSAANALKGLAEPFSAESAEALAFVQLLQPLMAEATRINTKALQAIPQDPRQLAVTLEYAPTPEEVTAEQIAEVSGFLLPPGDAPNAEEIQALRDEWSALAESAWLAH
jgi:hypothetical protein